MTTKRPRRSTHAPKRSELFALLRAADRHLGALVKRTNTEAGSFAERGRYDRAQRTIVHAQQYARMRTELRELSRRWRRGAANAPENSSRPPLWRYYGPVARAVVALGGTTHRDELWRAFDDASGSEELPAPDLDTASKIRRAMLREGFIARGTRDQWTLTDAGLRLARTFTDTSARADGTAPSAG